MFQTVKGKIRAPSKEEFRKKINRSPDELDGTVYCMVKEEEWEERPGVLEISLGKPSQYSRNEWAQVAEEEGDEDNFEDWEQGHYGDVPLVDL